ncbi:MAG TPA: tetratricopeptide repeat protein [Thermoanaerobaculia bacterium]|nr:tetratricopeptide repeat protein [Thermoanaerobaculia bacterium]
MPEWVRTVAWQELVHLHLRADRQTDAVALLRQAVSQLPGQTQLAVQLAYLLERQGSAADAQKVLAGIRTAETSGGSPRHRYGQWPAAALDDVRRSLTQQSLLRLAALARALESTPARGGRG